MIIKKIKLTNFRQYKHEEITFSNDSDKKITVIVGDNTAGKTTLVRAFLWCLYGTNNFGDKILLNKEEQNTLKLNEVKTTRVILELEHSNCSYTIETHEDYYKNTDGLVKVKNKVTTRIYKVDSDSSYVVPENKVEEEIKEILSYDLKDYFFFDGENNSIDFVSSRKNLTDAVSDLMGVKRLEAVNEYFDPRKRDSVTSKFRDKLVSTDEDKLQSLNDLLEQYQTDMESDEKFINNKDDGLNKIIEELKLQIDQKEIILRNNDDIKDEQSKIKTLRSDLNNDRNARDSEFSNLINTLNQSNMFLKLLFSVSFKKNNFEKMVLESSFTNENSLSHISEEAIDQLIKRGKCLCGTKIENGSEAYNHLLMSKEHMAPKNYGKYASDFVEFENSNYKYSQVFYESFTNSCDKVLNLIERIDNNVENIKKIEKKIEGRIDVGEVQKELNALRIQLASKEGQLKFIIEQSIPKYVENIKKTTERINDLTSKTKGNDFVKKCIDYSEFIFEKTRTRINDKKSDIRTNLQRIVNESFQSMYHGNRTIVINEDFKADAVLTDNQELDKSTGLETVKNFAFVTGLMELVKNKIADDTDDEVDKEFPLVMDAPFSNTDEIHIKNICAALPKYCNQIIIVIMKKDFNTAKFAIENKIGKLYNIEKVNNSETYSQILEDKNV